MTNNPPMKITIFAELVYKITIKLTRIPYRAPGYLVTVKLCDDQTSIK